LGSFINKAIKESPARLNLPPGGVIIYLTKENPT
jgi:hypothetical protein